MFKLVQPKGQYWMQSCNTDMSQCAGIYFILAQPRTLQTMKSTPYNKCKWYYIHEL